MKYERICLNCFYNFPLDRDEENNRIGEHGTCACHTIEFEDTNPDFDTYGMGTEELIKIFPNGCSCFKLEFKKYVELVKQK